VNPHFASFFFILHSRAFFCCSGSRGYPQRHLLLRPTPFEAPPDLIQEFFLKLCSAQTCFRFCLSFGDVICFPSHCNFPEYRYALPSLHFIAGRCRQRRCTRRRRRCDAAPRRGEHTTQTPEVLSVPCRGSFHSRLYLYEFAYTDLPL